MRQLITLLVCVITLASSSVYAESFLQSSRARGISQLIWTAQFEDAIDSSNVLLLADSTRLPGHLLLGIAYYTISNDYRTDLYLDQATYHLDSTIAIARSQIKSRGEDADLIFVLGSAYAFRAASRGEHGRWWGAVKDGLKSAPNLSKALAMDSGLYDAYLGLGTYHYWKSAKAKHFKWLPFISDTREQGIREITTASLLGNITPIAAQKALIVIYMNENRYADARLIADSVLKAHPFDLIALMRLAQSLVETEDWDEAESVVGRLRDQWQKSPLRDACGIREADYLDARIQLGRGNGKAAATLLESILAAGDSCKNNAFYGETRDKAKSVTLPTQ